MSKPKPKKENAISKAAHVVLQKLWGKKRVLFKETRVRCRLVMDTDTKKVSLECSVRSNARSNINGDLWGHALLDANETPDRLLYLGASAAEKIAGFQNDAYGDTHNPPIVANSMQSAIREIFAKAERASTRPSVGKSTDDKAYDGAI